MSRTGRYYYGSAAPALRPDEYSASPQRRRKTQQGRGVSPQSRQRARAAARANLLSIAALVLVVAAMAVCLFAYIGLQSSVTSAVEEIADLETELSDLRSDNEEALNAIESGISLDEIKYRAIAELGMSYAQEDQIITYSSDDTDYVRQVIQP